jgi:N-acetylglucosaminyldiphosphoundecaprenol N-acetyl-beta-D-mannosaminyltransferase
MTASSAETSSDRESMPPNLSYCQLGVRVDAVQIPEVIEILERWITCRGRAQYVAVTGMHGMTEAQTDPQLKKVLNQAGLVVPDGMPLVWLARYYGFKLKRRVYGPELMLSFCVATASKGLRHFFYGGAEGVAQALAETLVQRFPGLVVAGTYTPPFRPLSADEENEITNLVNTTQPDILWVGLGTPKQEKWMHAHLYLAVPAMVGVGAAFDLNTGRLKQAPSWMQENGLEWLFRLCAEPRRLWRRYLLQGPKFVYYVLAEITRLRKFS